MEYEIYVTSEKSLSLRSVDYEGIMYIVNAKTLRQAFYLIYNVIWQDKQNGYGIVYYWNKNTGKERKSRFSE